MKRIETAAIVGGGALGLMYGQAMKSALGDGLYFVAEGDRHERFRNAEYLINGTAERFAVKKPGHSGPKPGLVLVSVKNYDLPTILSALETLCGPETAVVSVLNGIDSETLLEGALPSSTVLYCCVQGMDAVKSGNAVTFSSRGKMLLGARGNKSSEALDAVKELCVRCALACETPADIHRSIWSKWMLNVGVNQVSAVTGATYGVFHTDGNLRALMEAAMREVVLLAAAEGVDLHDDDIQKWYPVLFSLGPEGKTSMLQDIEHRRKTEVESFSGKIIEMARSLGISVPVNETLYRIVKVREGLFGV